MKRKATAGRPRLIGGNPGMPKQLEWWKPIKMNWFMLMLVLSRVWFQNNQAYINNMNLNISACNPNATYFDWKESSVYFGWNSLNINDLHISQESLLNILHFNSSGLCVPCAATSSKHQSSKLAQTVRVNLNYCENPKIASVNLCEESIYKSISIWVVQTPGENPEGFRWM